MGLTWGQHGPTWASSGPSWGQLGAYLGQLGANLVQKLSPEPPIIIDFPLFFHGILGIRPFQVYADLGVILGASWGHLGAILGHLGPSWGHLGAILGPS